MKMLFAKVPNEINSIRTNYDMHQFYQTDYLNKKYELIFQDNMGEVYASPFSDEEINDNNPIFDIKKYFGQDLDIINKITIVFFVETPKGTVLEGWYQSAEIFKNCHCIAPRNRNYYFKAKVIDAVWLPDEIHITTKLKFNNFTIPAGQEAKRIHKFISSYSGKKRNLVFDEELEKVKIPKISNIQQCIKQCFALNDADAKSPVDDFKIIKMCLQTIEDHGGKEEIYSLLADSYNSLGQDDLCLLYNQMRFEANRSYENKLEYATSLYFSIYRNKALYYFKELMEEKPTDLIRLGLADLYCDQNHLLTAYQLYDEIQEEEYLSEKHSAMEFIRKHLPNAPSLKNICTVSGITEVNMEKCYLPINEMPLPWEQVDQNGKPFYLDPIRGKPVPKTPEEEIRQKTVRYLMDCLKIPADNIRVEESLNHLEKSLKGRMDIFVSCYVKGIPKNLLIVECKEPNVSVLGDPVQQVFNYNLVRPSKYLLVTNGRDSLIFTYNASEDEYTNCAQLPDFQGMSSRLSIESVTKNIGKWKRPTRAYLETPDCLNNANYNGTIGIDTNRDIKVLAVNIHYCLVDPEEKFPDNKKGLLCTITKDHGLTYRTSTDASGSKISLNYRWFEVSDRNSNTQNVYLAVVGFVNKKQTSNLLVSVEHKGKAKQQLGLRLDAYVEQDGNIFSITHDGRRSRKTNKSTIDFVAKYCPQLLKNEKEVYLGCLDNSRNLSFKGDRELEFILRIIDYTLLRYELWLDERKENFI